MDLLNLWLSIILYIAGIILLIILIILGIKLIKILDKVDRVVDNIEEKVNTFNGALAVLGRVSDGIASISDSIVFAVTQAVSKIIGRFTKKKEEEDYE